MVLQSNTRTCCSSGPKLNNGSGRFWLKKRNLHITCSCPRQFEMDLMYTHAHTHTYTNTHTNTHTQTCHHHFSEGVGSALSLQPSLLSPHFISSLSDSTPRPPQSHTHTHTHTLTPTLTLTRLHTLTLTRLHTCVFPFPLFEMSFRRGSYPLSSPLIGYTSMSHTMSLSSGCSFLSIFLSRFSSKRSRYCEVILCRLLQSFLFVFYTNTGVLFHTVWTDLFPTMRLAVRLMFNTY